MLIQCPESADAAVRAQPTGLHLLLVGDEEFREDVDAAFGEDADLTLEVAPSLAAVQERRDVDCLVVLWAAITDGDAPEDVDGGDGFLETVRTTAPDLPVAVLVDEATGELADAIRTRRLTAVLERDDGLERLPDRVRDLAERRRLAALSRRSLASVEFAGAAIAIVDPGDDIQFASRSFAMQFGYDRASLPGTPWQTLFTDEAVDHLESTAIPTVADGWRWTGGCTGRRNDGETFDARLRTGGLEDGSLVFVLEGSETAGTDGDDEREN